MQIFYINKNKCKDLTPKIFKDDKELYKLLVSGVVLSSCLTTDLMAYTKGDIQNSLQPIVDLIVDLAEPVSYAFMTKGFLTWAGGMEEKGKKQVKLAITGFLGVNFAPEIFNILKSIKLS